jgi:hypothetical protein
MFGMIRERRDSLHNTRPMLGLLEKNGKPQINPFFFLSSVTDLTLRAYLVSKRVKR